MMLSQTINRLSLRSNCIVFMKPIALTNKHLNLIVVPASLRKILFDHYHGGPSGAHMGEYKTLHRMRLRFIWPKMRGDIKTWVSSCAQCISCNAWRSKKSELYLFGLCMLTCGHLAAYVITMVTVTS